MRALSFALLLALASGVSAQTDTRLHGTWMANPDSLPEIANPEVEMLSLWMEFDASGRALVQAHVRQNGEETRNIGEVSYSAEDGSVVFNGSPVRLIFRENGDMRFSSPDGSDAVELLRADAPIGGLDVIGSWQIVDGPAETVTLGGGQSPAEARFYLHDRLFDSGTWFVDARGLTLDTPGMGTVTYTALSRDGDSLTLTGSGEPLTLRPLAEVPAPR